jgi:hypothetical protein
MNRYRNKHTGAFSKPLNREVKVERLNPKKEVNHETAKPDPVLDRLDEKGYRIS